MAPQTYTESQAGMAVTCNTRIKGRKTGSLGQAGPVRIRKLQVQGETMPQ